MRVSPAEARPNRSTARRVPYQPTNGVRSCRRLLRGVAKSVALQVEAKRVHTRHLYGGVRAGFSATTVLDRQDLGASYDGPIPDADNAMVLSEQVTITIEIEGRPAPRCCLMRR